jgi:CheY-like chemotaxis protein
MPDSKTILVVDDEAPFRNILNSVLQNEGYQVETASDGDEAIVKIEQRKFDLILLDIHMERVDGFEVLKLVKEKYAETKVIVLTGFSELANAIKAQQMGAEAFISKPYDLIDLLETIQRIIVTT